MNDMDDEIDMGETLGGRIVAARASEGLSTAQLARRLGVQTGTLSAWESDRSEPRPNQLVRISGLLNVSPTWLLTGAGESPTEAMGSTELAQIRSVLGRLREQTRAMSEQIDGLDKRLQSYQSYEA